MSVATAAICQKRKRVDRETTRKLHMEASSAQQSAVEKSSVDNQPKKDSMEDTRLAAKMTTKSLVKLRKRIHAIKPEQVLSQEDPTIVVVRDQTVPAIGPIEDTQEKDIDIMALDKGTDGISLENLKLSKLGSVELRMLSSGSRARKIRLDIEEKMIEKEEQFQKKIMETKPSQRDFFIPVANKFSKTLIAIPQHIKEQARPFEKLIHDLEMIDVKPQNILFNPNTHGANYQYRASTQSLFMEVTGTCPEITLVDMQKALNAEFIKVQNKQMENENDPVEFLSRAVSAAKHKNVSHSYIFLDKKEGINCIFACAEILFARIKFTPQSFLIQINQLLQASAISRPGYSIFAQTMEGVLELLLQIEEPHNNKYATKCTLILLRYCILSSLIRFIGQLTIQKSEFYDNDSILFNNESWNRAADIIEEIETCKFVGNINMLLIPSLDEITSSRILARIQGAVRDYSIAAQRRLINGEDEHQNLFRIHDIIHYIILILLIQKDGTCAKKDNIWGIFLASASISNPHPMFKHFKAIVDEECRFAIKSAVKRASNVIYNAIQKHLIPYLLIFTQPTYKLVESISNSLILPDSDIIIRISYELLKIQNVYCNISEKKIQNIIKEI